MICVPSQRKVGNALVRVLIWLVFTGGNPVMNIKEPSLLNCLYVKVIPSIAPKQEYILENAIESRLCFRPFVTGLSLNLK